MKCDVNMAGVNCKSLSCEHTLHLVKIAPVKKSERELRLAGRMVAMRLDMGGEMTDEKISVAREKVMALTVMALFFSPEWREISVSRFEFTRETSDRSRVH